VSPDDVADLIASCKYPSLLAWEEMRDEAASDRERWLTRLRADLEREPARRWAAAIVLARLGAEDSDELALSVLRETDWSQIPGTGFAFWQQAAWVIRDALEEGRRPGAREVALDAIARSDLRAPEWTDVVDEALGMLDATPFDARVTAALSRVASEHWNEATRDTAAELLEDRSS
jgi:hypothetical protein